MMKNILLISLLAAIAAQAQTLQITADEPVQYPALPAPEWRPAPNGLATAELRITTTAAAIRLNFGGLFLPEGAEMFLYSRTAVHGPYTGSGPLNVPEFDSQPLAGPEVVIAIRATPTAGWPFTLQGIEQLAPANLNLLPIFTPAPARKRPIDFRSAYINDTLVHFNVEDNIAIMEGDIVLGPVDQLTAPKNKNQDRASFAITNQYDNHWPNGVVPYTVAYGGGLIPSDTLDQKITAAVNYWNSRFPGILVKRTNQPDYVTLRLANSVCQSPIGRKGGMQFVDLDNSCSTGNIVHELGHVLGLFHEHARYDRNSFIMVNTANVEPANLYNFAMKDAGVAVNLGPYDFGSIMHYSSTAFALDPAKPTITPLAALPPGIIMGQRSALSSGDEAGVRARYCTGGFYIAPSTINIDPDGETHSFNITIPPYCSWQASETANWITILSALSGTGSTTVKFTATANKTASYRNAAIKIGDRLIFIAQPMFNNQ